MQNFLASRRSIWAFLLVGIAAVLVAVIAALVYQTKPTSINSPADNTNRTAVPELKVDHQDVPSNQLPDKFPSELPLETNAKVIDNFNATASNGNYQATRQYESANTPDDNYRTFEAYFKRNGWDILSAANTADDKSLTVKKDNTIIQAIFYRNTVSKASVVKVSVTIIPSTTAN